MSSETEVLMTIRGSSGGRETYSFLERVLPGTTLLFLVLVLANSTDRALALWLCAGHVVSNVLMSWVISRLDQTSSRIGELVKLGFNLVYVFVATLLGGHSTLIWILHLVQICRTMLVFPASSIRVGSAIAFGASAAWAEHLAGGRFGKAIEPLIVLVALAILTDALFKFFDRLLKREQKMLLKSEHLRRLSGRMEAVGSLAAGLAHEINTPIQYVSDSLDFVRQGVEQLLIDGRQQGDFIEALLAARRSGMPMPRAENQSEDKLQSQAFLRENLPAALARISLGLERVSEIVCAMRVFSHPGSSEQNWADIKKSLASAITMTSSEWKEIATVELDLVDLPRVRCNIAEIGQVFLNLLVNAADAIRQTESKTLGLIQVATRCLGDRWVEISISDNGCGVPEDAKEHIFDPFFTTKEVGKGTGQGLAMAMNVVASLHDGKMDLQSSEGQGTRVSVILPINGKGGTDET